jgi:hypothetical protein
MVRTPAHTFIFGLHFLIILTYVSLCFSYSSTICHFLPESVVGLVPKRGCLLTLAYYAFPT